MYVHKKCKACTQPVFHINNRWKVCNWIITGVLMVKFTQCSIIFVIVWKYQKFKFKNTSKIVKL